MILKTIIDRLNQRVEVSNIFDRLYGLCELTGDNGWVNYIGNGEAIPVTNYDAKVGTLFWARRGKVNISKIDSLRVSGCKQMYSTKFNLSAFAVVKKNHVPCDTEDAADWIASRVYKLVSGRDYGFKEVIDVVSYEVIPVGYTVGDKTLPENLHYATVVIELLVEIVSGSEDTCYDICDTGDIPLPPDFLPCNPCLTEVAVDGVTIGGNGTEADPLYAIGGGGGTPLTVKDEGTNVSTNTTTLNFTGAGVTASLTSPSVVEVNIPSGGGGGEDLQQTTDLGNTTTNDIAFIGNTQGLLFDNGSRVRKGTTDAGLGGAKGTAQICSIAYELKWEAGRLYYMEQDGFTIRDVTHNFTNVPQVTDDASKGFVIGSRWGLDDGSVYVCTDNTNGAAVWALQTGGGVTAVTGSAPIASSGGATPDISITQATTVSDGYLSATDFNTFDGKQDALTAGTGIDLTGNIVTNTAPDQIVSLLSGTDINVTGTYPNFTIDNTNPDQVVTLTGGTAISTSGTYPNFTIDNTAPDQTVTLTAGTGISTSGTYPSFTIDNTAPDQIVSITGGTDISVTGTYPNFTIDNTQDLSGYVPYTGATQDVDLGTNKLTTDALEFSLTPTNSPGAGQIAYVGNTGALAYNLNGSAVTSQIGQTLHAFVHNADSVTITKGQAVYLFGASGNKASVKLANNTSDATSAKTLGLAAENITSGQNGFVIVHGVLDGLNTGSYNAGDTLYLGATAGSLTATKPYAPNHLVYIGVVEKANNGNGQIYVRVQNGYELNEIHDVDLITTPPVNKDLLTYVTGSPNLWKNQSLGTILGGNTSQYVRGDGTLATFPTIPTGTVTSVSATVPSPASPALSVTVTNPTTTPAIAITANGNTSQYIRGDGSLATLPTGGSGTVTSVGLTMPAAFSVANSPVTTSGTLSVTGAGTSAQYIRGDGTLATFPTIPAASVVYKSAISSATHTGTANTVKYTQLIPANTFVAGDVVRITYRTAKTGTANSMTLRIYANTTPDLSGSPILLGSHQNAGAPLFLVNQMIRHLAIKTANNNTEVYFAPGLGVATDYGLYDLTSTCAVDWTQQQYIVFALQLNTTGTDVAFGSFYMIEKP